MVAALEAWRQDRFDLDQVYIHDATAHWATIAISGPTAKAMVGGLGLRVELDDAAFPHMSVRDARFGGRPGAGGARQLHRRARLRDPRAGAAWRDAVADAHGRPARFRSASKRSACCGRRKANPLYRPGHRRRDHAARSRHGRAACQAAGCLCRRPLAVHAGGLQAGPQAAGRQADDGCSGDPHRRPRDRGSGSAASAASAM